MAFLSVCNCFLGGTVSSIFNVGVDDTFVSAGVASGRLTKRYLWGLARSACSVDYVTLDKDVWQVLAGIPLLKWAEVYHVHLHFSEALHYL